MPVQNRRQHKKLVLGSGIFFLPTGGGGGALEDFQ